MYLYREINTAPSWLIPALALIGLILVGIAVQLSLSPQLDQQILNWFRDNRTPNLDYFFKMITWLGSLYLWAPVILIGALVLYYYYDKTYTILLSMSFFGAVVMTFVLKHLISRPRPELADGADYVGIALSFPSGHATQVTAAALIVWLLLRRIRFQWSVIVAPVLLFIVVMVAISRLYLQVHYPSDILAGELVAILWVSTVNTMIKKREIKLKQIKSQRDKGNNAKKTA